MITLTQIERDKFSSWLEQESKSDDEMSEQLSKLTGHEVMVKHMKQRAMIFTLVAGELRKIEEVEI